MMHMYMSSPIGTLLLVEEDGALTQLQFDGEPPADCKEETNPLLLDARRQLEEYFAGKRRTFDLPLRPKGTPFQKACYQALREIPYGQTRSYAEIAQCVGKPKACRAVGNANHNNPIGIIIPCHRVIGKSGALTGYGGGLDKKEFLLRLEGIEL